jgi:Domain of unknown function (DUF4375)
MAVGIDVILRTKNDSALCSKLYTRLVEHYGGDDLDVSSCADAHQLVILTWQATGIIDNGGFRYLFEGYFKGDPYFERTAAAFKSINASRCAEAFQEALGLFRNSMPPKDLDVREKIYLSKSESQRDAIDSKFWSASKNIRKFLASFIRENREAIAKL